MFGLGGQGKPLFEFDMQKELEKNPAKGKALTAEIDAEMEKIKTHLQSNPSSEELDDYGVLLQGFSALKAIITDICNKKLG